MWRGWVGRETVLTARDTRRANTSNFNESKYLSPTHVLTFNVSCVAIIHCFRCGGWEVESKYLQMGEMVLFLLSYVESSGTRNLHHSHLVF